MDPLTHCLLGACAARAVVGQRLGRAALLIGAVGGEIPDLDVVLPADPALPWEWHRHFTHSIVCAPLMGALAALPFLAFARWRRAWKLVLAAAIAGALTHGVLDMCTSWGTYWLWPLVNRRLAWDIISIVDPIFTVALLAGVVAALVTRAAWPARGALGACLLYLGLGIVQHHRAASMQETLAASRGETRDRGRVAPTLGNLILWRSVYQSGDMLHADAMRVGWPGNATVIRGGEAILAARARDLPGGAADDARVAAVFAAFRVFADGYVAALPEDARVIGDMRYSFSTGGFQPLWGIRIDPGGATPSVHWVFLGGDRRAMLRNTWNDLTGGGEAP